jgi:hypothetical protein
LLCGATGLQHHSYNKLAYGCVDPMIVMCTCVCKFRFLWLIFLSYVWVKHHVRQAQSSKVILHLHVGDMPHWKAVKNITLFAEEVIPRVRKLTSSALQVAAE